MIREEQIKQAAYSTYAIVSSPVVFKAQCNCFIEGANWADEHPSQQSLAKELYRLGYPITLNGDIISKEEENKMMENYMKYKQEQLIEKACKWLIENMHDYFDGDSEFAVASDFITCDEFIESFKKEMEK